MIILYYLRSIVCYTMVFLFFTVFSLAVLPVLWIIGLFSLKAREKCTRAIANTALSIILLFAGVKSVVVGRENIPDEPALFVSNHRSFFDIIVVYPLFRGKRLGFVAKKEFAKLLPFKLWLLWCGSIFLDRDNPREGLKTINQAADDITGGKSMWIYPEGTRGHEDGNLPFHAGSFRIAEKAGCKIVPVAQCHGDDAFEKHMPYLKPTKMITAFGKPIDTQGLDRNQLRQLYKEAEEECLRLYRENN